MTRRLAFVLPLLFACSLFLNACGLESAAEGDGDIDIERTDSDSDRSDTIDQRDNDSQEANEDGDTASEDGDTSVEDGDTMPENGDEPDEDRDTNVEDGDADNDVLDGDNDTTIVDGDSDGSTDIPRVNVVTFNVDRFFDTNCDSGDCGSGGYEDVPTQVAYDERAAQIAAAIDAMDADIVILEEIEMQKGLDDINAKTKNPYPISILGETGTTRATVDVGILARGSLVNVYHHYNEPMSTADGVSTHFARDFLELRIKLQNRSVIVFGAHFKSKNSDDAARRLAEAKTAAKILRGVALQNTNALVVMGGDLNDTPDSEPVSALIGDGNLLRAAADCTGTSCATYYYSREYQAIDHLLLSQDTKGRYVAHSTRSFRGGSGGNIGYAGSDHAALFATFTFAQ